MAYCGSYYPEGMDHQQLVTAYRCALEELKEIKKKVRKRKSIDRIAWKAEAAQRFAKGGHWK